jgi:hypothetical protein
MPPKCRLHPDRTTQELNLNAQRIEAIKNNESVSLQQTMSTNPTLHNPPLQFQRT